MAVFNDIEIGKRLAEIEKENGLNNKEFAEKVNANEAFWSKVKKGQKPLSERYMEKLKDEFGVNLVWLLFGEGNRYGPIGQEKSDADYLSASDQLLSAVNEEIKTMQLSLERLTKAAQVMPHSSISKVRPAEPMNLNLGKKRGSQKSDKQKGIGFEKGK